VDRVPVAFQRASDIAAEPVGARRAACDEVLGGALGHYEQVIGGTVRDKMPMPLQGVHRRAGEDYPAAERASRRSLQGLPEATARRSRRAGEC
jgi:hypothetical protein